MTTQRLSIARRPTRLLAYGLGAVFVLALPELVPSAFVLHVIIAVVINAPLALAQNLITGFTGLLTLGQAAFYGLGAYTSALLVMRLGAPWPIAFLAAGLVAGIFGILLGFPCLRVGSDYLCLMTIGFGEIFRVVAVHWTAVTGGSRGIPAVPPARIGPIVFSSLRHEYFLSLAIAALCYFFMWGLTRSRAGRALIAIREDETAASTMGINLSYYKVLPFAFGSLWAGFSGSLLAHSMRFVGPMSFTMDESLLHMQMAILGGLGSLPGSILGAAILISIPQLFQSIYRYRVLLNGVVMLVLLAWRPQGIMGTSAVAASTKLQIRPLLMRLLGRRVETAEATGASSSPTREQQQ